MALSEFILVTAIDSRPYKGGGTWLINAEMIAYGAQEFLSPDPDYTNGYQPAGLTDTGAIPVVHLFLKYTPQAYPTTSLTPPPIEDEDVPMLPRLRPTDLWVEGFMEDFYGLLMGDRPPAEVEQLGEPLIDYGSLIVTDTTISFDITPVSNADTYYVLVDGTLVQDDANTSISITGLDAATQYAIILQARKSDLTYRNSPLHVELITTTSSP